ncbi:MAG TPA: glycosyltransferase family 87 protein, partial [Candidatus Methylomirabilis sp.]|nr:glycosyltransferase family 87 protein [Candidatus Methylomirabilis sp.]
LVVRLCQLIVKQSTASGWGVPWYGDAHVTLAVLLAGATTWGLDAGQLVIWTTLWIYAAIYALARKREVTAGIALAAASLKITTSFPFLLLLLARRHWKAWIAFAAVLTLLCLCLYPPDRLAGLVAGQFENVRQARQVGEINDYSFSGPFHDDMLGLEHWLYCLGLRNNGVISLLQLGILFVIGLGLLREFLVRVRPVDELRHAVLLCLFSCVFLYHRIYDSVILALPIFYCVDRAREESHRRAILYKAVATGLVLVLNFPRGGVLIRLSNWSQSSGLAGRLVQILVLPYCTWILLASLFLLWYLGREPRGIALSDDPS